ncbi:MAG TPA: serine/threonine-protein kinase [Ktedonobacteraceae bacterium]|nr:serine/threonine-protein kinase [Ktedonobacteraceae bacterium]
MFTAQVVDWQGKMLGRYRLVHLLGRGGMGEVWQAEDTELARQVAIKLLPPVLRHEEDYLRAFSNEARTIASLEHPHILAVHDFGEFQSGDEIITYLVMPLVNNTLRTRIKTAGAGLARARGPLLARARGPLLTPAHGPLLPIPTSLSYLRQAAQAIDYAHSKRILHRDIKPANMLLQDDWLFLTDFGIAKLLSTSTYRSRTHAGAGTPGYMAPEQIRGKSQPASDLYSLAIVAYQLLTGHMPFSGDEPYAIFIKHILHDPPSPRQFNARLPEAVAHTLLRSLSRQPEERHPSCQAFVAELEQGWNINGMQNNLAPFDTDTTLLAPWNKRAAASLPTQNSGSTLTPFPSANQHGSQTSQTPTPSTLPDWSAGSVNRADEVPTTKTDFDKKRRTSNRSRRTFLLGGAAAALFVAGGGIALSSFYHPAVSMPQKLSGGSAVLKLTGHTQDVNDVRWNPRGRYLVSAGKDGRVLLWDIDTLMASSNGKLRTADQPAVSYLPDETVLTNKLDWSPDGRFLATFTDQKTWDNISDTMVIYDIFTGPPGAQPALYYDAAIAQDGGLFSPAWSPKGDIIATGVDKDIEVALWNVGQTKRATTTLRDTTGTGAKEVQGGTLYVETLCWSLDGTWLVGIDSHAHLDIWNTATNTMQRVALPDRTKVLHFSAAALEFAHIYSRKVVASPTTPTLFAATDNDVIALYDVQKRAFTRLLGTDDPNALQAIPDGQSPFYAQVTTLAWSPSGRYLAGSYLSTNLIYLWDLQNPRPRLKNGTQMPDFTIGKGGHTNVISDLTWSPDMRYLASSSLDSTVIVWKMD